MLILHRLYFFSNVQLTVTCFVFCPAETDGPAGDIHICGMCKLQFRNIETFLLHKRQSCTATANSRSNSLTTQSQLQKPNEVIYTNNNNNEDNAGTHETQEEELEVTHTQEVPFSGEETEDQGDSTEEVVLIEVPADNMDHLEQGLDPGGAVVSLQSALMSSQPGQITMISQAGGEDTHETTVVSYRFSYKKLY